MGAAIGIDFGTTNTVVSYKNKYGKFKQLSFNGQILVPSVLFFKSAREYLYGHTAKQMGLSRPRAVASGFKMLLGEMHYHMPLRSDAGEDIKLRPALAVRLFLNKIISALEEKLIKEFGSENGLIDRMVITVPVKFSTVEKAAIRKAAMEAVGRGDKIKVRLALEPTAAAIGAMSDTEDFGNEPILVYDFGGGTFDISIIKKENGAYKQLYSDGDPRLGGNNLTNILVAQLLEIINDDYGTEFPLDENEFDEDIHGISRDQYALNMASLINSANAIKEALSDEEEAGADINIFVKRDVNEIFGCELDKSDLEDLLGDEIGKTVDITVQAVRAYAEVHGESVRHLVLAGGSSQIPLVRKLLADRLPEVVIHADGNSATLISRGAAILAQHIDELENMTSQTSSARIGVSATEGVCYNKFHMIIPENQKLPCHGSKDFYLANDGQRTLDIRYYEHDVKKNPGAVSVVDEGIREVDTLHIELPENLQRANTVVSVSFQLNTDGSMDVGAVIKDWNGVLLKSENLHVTKDSDLV